MNRTRVAQMVEHRADSPEVGSSKLPPRTWRNKWGEYLGRVECPYARRWVIESPTGYSLRIHHFYKSDDKRYYHDHPWWFLTLVLRGSYIDVSASGQDKLTPGSVRFRKSSHAHSVVVNHDYRENGVWTIVLTGPKSRKWGFWVNGKFKKANKYFLEHGHPPCAEL